MAPAYQCRCPTCQTVVDAPETEARLRCPKCGYDDANPYFTGIPTAQAVAPVGVAAGTALPPSLPGAPRILTPEAKTAQDAAFKWGLASLIGGFLILLPYFLGFAAVHYGNKAKKLGAGNTAGLIMGWVAVVLGILGLAFVIVLLLLALAGGEAAPQIAR